MLSWNEAHTPSHRRVEVLVGTGMSALGIGVVSATIALWVGIGPNGPTHDELMPSTEARSTSLGHPYYGKLLGGVKMPIEGPHHSVQRSTRARRWIWGTPYLVRSLLVAAKDVHTSVGGQPLVMGNLSKKGGGDIKMSRSHNTGRDVDYAYWTETKDGQSVKSDYHRFGDDGRSKNAPGRYRLDLKRNWAFIRAMMDSPEAELQYLITSPGIEKLLLEYARSIGEPSHVIHRVERMMMLPGWAKPHDNHVHLRVLCSPADWKAGCNNGGPVWPWAESMYGALEQARRQLQPDLTGDNATARLDALKRVAKRRIDTAVIDVAESLLHDRRDIRQQALDTLLAITTEANAHTVLKVARLMDRTVAEQLLKKALPMAGPEGLDTARAIRDGAHPALEGSVDKALLRTAKKVLVEYRWVKAILPGGP